MMYKTAQQIMEKFGCHESTYYATRKIIKKHPKRYTHMAIMGRLTSAPCFADARIFGKKLEANEDVPPFDMQETANLMGDLFND